MSTNDIRDLLLFAVKRASTYLESLGTRPVSPTSNAVSSLVHMLDMPLPDNGTPPEKVLELIDDFGSPATVASAGGRYFGFVVGGTLPASLAANYLAGAWDQNCFSWTSSPAAAAFEEATMRWIKQALGISSAVDGAFVTGATMANFTCLAAARNQVLRSVGWDVGKHGLFGAPGISVYISDQAHASVLKALSLLGFGRERIRRLPTDGQGRIVPRDLPSIMGPAIVCIQAGNVNSGAFDPANLLIEWAHGQGAWVHVDGAFGLWVLASDKRRYLGNGLVDADSWALDAHKWLNVPHDSGIALVAKSDALRDAMSIDGEYLLKGERREAMNATPECSRRARAVDVWACLMSLGRIGLSELIDRTCQLTVGMAESLRVEGIEILNEVVLNQILVSFGSARRTNAVISQIQRGGDCWCGSTMWRGKKAKTGQRLKVRKLTFGIFSKSERAQDSVFLTSEPTMM